MEVLVGRHDLLLHVGGNLDVVVVARQCQPAEFAGQVAHLVDLLLVEELRVAKSVSTFVFFHSPNSSFFLVQAKSPI